MRKDKTMKKAIIAILISLASFAGAAYEFYTDITLSDLGNDLWQYSFAFENTGSEDIEEITVWTEYGLTGLEITTVNAQGWDEIIIPADDFIKSGAGYDLLNTDTPLASGGTISGFSVAFVYAGDATLLEMPWYECINASTYETQYSSIPEPATMDLLGLGGLFIRRKRA